MIYLLLIITAAGLLGLGYLGQTVKQAVVQSVKDGKLTDAILTRKTRGQVLWDDHKAGVCFTVGLLLGLAIGVISK